jgi:hypothetical protein
VKPSRPSGTSGVYDATRCVQVGRRPSVEKLWRHAGSKVSSKVRGVKVQISNIRQAIIKTISGLQA